MTAPTHTVDGGSSALTVFDGKTEIYRGGWVATAYIVREEEARRVGEALSRLGIEGVLRLEEQRDPQYRYAQNVARAAGRGAGAVAGLLVGLTSYRLAMRGEEWWECYSNFMSRELASASSLQDVYSTVRRFLISCKGAAIGREAKLKRVSRAYHGARSALETLYVDPDSLLRKGGDWLLASLRSALSEKRPTKTLVFSIKMAYYHVRRVGDLTALRLDAPIPVDVRIACLTYSSLMVEGPGYRGLVANPEPAWRAWEIASATSNIPVHHLDTVAWLSGWAPRDLDLSGARRAIEELLEPYAGKGARRIAVMLARRRCTD